jgi:hypothetical protein
MDYIIFSLLKFNLLNLKLSLNSQSINTLPYVFELLDLNLRPESTNLSILQNTYYFPPRQI